MAAKVIVILSGVTFSKPADWNPFTNTVELIGGSGGGGGGGTGIGVASGSGGGAGAGGEYRILSNFDFGIVSSVAISIGAAGTAGGPATGGGLGGDTTFGAVLLAKGGGGGGPGASGNTPGTGGARGLGGFGGSSHDGGNGGAGGAGAINTGGGGGGGGGAGGASANGTSGAAGASNDVGGVGGAGGASNGGTAGASNGGNGGNGTHWTDTSSFVVAGAGGGGGGGNGAPSQLVDPTVPGGRGGNYGGGGGGGGGSHRGGGSGQPGGVGTQGFIVVTYQPLATLTAQTGSYALTGRSVRLLASRRLVAQTGSFAWSGRAVSLIFRRLLVALPGAFSWKGRTVVLNRVLVDPFSPQDTGLKKRVWAERRPNSKQNVVFWNVPVPMPKTFQGFHVYRSPQPTTDLTSPTLERLTTAPVGVPFFIDAQPASEPFGVPSYLVTGLNTGQEWVLEGGVAVGDNTDDDRYGRRFPILSMPRIYKEFRRRKDILLGLNSERVVFLIRRLAGKRCPECFQGAYETSGRADCGNCFGTGWDRAYEPVEALCRVGTLEEALRLQPAGLEFASSPKGWHVGFPLVRQGDVVVRLDGKRYEVQRISLTVHQGIITGQDYDLVAYDPNHPIYNFPIEP